MSEPAMVFTAANKGLREKYLKDRAYYEGARGAVNAAAGAGIATARQAEQLKAAKEKKAAEAAAAAAKAAADATAKQAVQLKAANQKKTAAEYAADEQKRQAAAKAAEAAAKAAAAASAKQAQELEQAKARAAASAQALAEAKSAAAEQAKQKYYSEIQNYESQLQQIRNETAVAEQALEEVAAQNAGFDLKKWLIFGGFGVAAWWILKK